MAMSPQAIGAIVGGVAGMTGGFLGSRAKKKKIKRMIRAIEAQKRENQDWYDRRYNEDSMQRADAQALLTHTAELIKNRNRQAAGTAAVMGGTEESVAAEKEANARALANTASAIAVNGENRKDQIEDRYLDTKNALDSQIAQLQGQKVSNLETIANTTNGLLEGAKTGYTAMGGMGIGMGDNTLPK